MMTEISGGDARRVSCAVSVFTSRPLPPLSIDGLRLFLSNALQSSLDLRFVVPQTHEVVVVERCDGDLLLRGDLARAFPRDDGAPRRDVARVLLRPRRQVPVEKLTQPRIKRGYATARAASVRVLQDFKFNSRSPFVARNLRR